MNPRRLGEDQDNIYIAIPKKRIPAQVDPYGNNGAMVYENDPQDDNLENIQQEVNDYESGPTNQGGPSPDPTPDAMDRNPSQVPIPGIDPYTAPPRPMPAGGLDYSNYPQDPSKATRQASGQSIQIPFDPRTAEKPFIERPNAQEYRKGAAGRIQGAKKVQVEAEKGIGQAEEGALQDQLDTNDRIRQSLQASMGVGLTKEQQEYADKIQGMIDEKQKQLDNLLNPQEARQSLGSRLITGLSVFLGGIGPGENEVLNSIMKERDRRASLLVRQADILGDQLKGYQALMASIRSPKGKMAMAKAYMNKMIELETKDAVLRGKIKINQAKVNQGIAKLQADTAKNLNDVYSEEYKRLKDEESDRYNRGYGGVPVGTWVDVNKLPPIDRQRLIRHPTIKNKGLLADTKEGKKWADDNLPNYRRLFQVLDKFVAFRNKYGGLVRKLKGKMPSKIKGEYNNLGAELVILAKKKDIQSALQQHEIDLIKDLYPSDPFSMFSTEDGKIRSTLERTENVVRDELLQRGIQPLRSLYRGK